MVTIVIAIKITRWPSYTIQTNGKLYIVNKLSSSITVFDLFKGKELVTFSTETEPHEVTTLENLNKVVVTNYGTQKMVGKSISIINLESNTLEKKLKSFENLLYKKYKKENNTGNNKNNSISLKTILQNISPIPILNKIIGLKLWWCFL